MNFIPGIELCRRFYQEAVLPLLGEEPPHAAALLDGGSEVLGFDTEMSMDHGWGPRVQLFFEAMPEGLEARIGARLPRVFQGFPVFVGIHDDGSYMLDAEGAEHRVVGTTWPAFLQTYLGLSGETDAIDWLRLPTQKLRTLATGPIFHDGIGLESARAAFAWYPPDVELYVLACLWQRIGQEEHLAGRAGCAGDEIGARIIASRLARDAMRIAFLLEREFPPYPKWFGTAFARLRAAPQLGPKVARVLAAEGWQMRDTALAEMFEAVAELQNASGLTAPRRAKAGPFFTRPYSAIEVHAGFCGALLAEITDPEMKAIADRTKAGSIDLISDSTDVLEATDGPLRLQWLD